MEPVGWWLELRVQIDEQDIRAERRACDFVGAQPAHAATDFLGDGNVSSEGEALKVGATTAEIRIREGIHHSVRLDVAIANAGLPVPEFLEGGIADEERDIPRGVSAFECTDFTCFG